MTKKNTSVKHKREIFLAKKNHGLRKKTGRQNARQTIKLSFQDDPLTVEKATQTKLNDKV